MLKRPNPLDERPHFVRRKKADLHGRVNSDLELEFTEAGLTSYAGLELLTRYLRRIEFNKLVRKYLTEVLPGGDFGSVTLLRTILGLLVVGGRRLRHIAFMKEDPIFERFCGLRDLPAERTLSYWLKKFSAKSVEALRQLNAELVASIVSGYLTARTLTIDVDGTVLSTGMQVAWAFRGYNPHRRKVPSYYPISAYLAETGHIIRLQNRPGNINDGTQSTGFLRELFSQIRQTLGKGYRLRFRMDGAFFKQSVVEVLASRKAEYAIKVPFWQFLDLHSQIRKCRRWTNAGKDVQGFFTTIHIKAWDRKFRVGIFRKRIHHKPANSYQLELLEMNEENWEYSAIATNLDFDERRLWRFMCGRGAHEKIIGELKSGLALDTIPTNHYGANNAWQQIVVLTHNLLTNFQVETGIPEKSLTEKRTTRWSLERVRSLRFTIFNRAGRLAAPRGKPTLRLLKNKRIKEAFLRIEEALKAA